VSKQRKDAVTKTTSTSPGAVALTIDYSNGAQKSFAVISCPQEELDILGVLRAAGLIKPGLVFKFTVTLKSDRLGRQRGFIASIDGVKAGQTNQWQLWINDRFVGAELITKGQFGAGTSVHPGDVLVLKLAGQ
jgi:hypothetical protein